LKPKLAVLRKERRAKPAARKAALRIADDTIQSLAEVFKLLADKSRLKILLALAHDGETHVSALCGLLEQSQPAVSHHLTLLRMAGLVGYRRDGKHNFYRVDSTLVGGLLERFFAGSGNGQRQIQFPNFALAYRARGS
jgi:ArsR family transcriptional regulator